MEKETPQSQGDFNPSTLPIRLVIGGAVMVAFFVLLYLIDQWYVRSRSQPEQQKLVTLDEPVTTSEQAASKASNPKTSSDPDLTFFKSLTETQDPRLMTPPPPLPPSKDKPIPPSSTGLPSQVASAPPQPSTPVQPPQASAPAAALTYAIQVGSFQSLMSAEEVRDRLKKAGFSSYIVSAEIEKGKNWYRVRVGTRLPRGDAEVLAERVRNQANLSPLVISEK